ncbi:MFS transporter [Shimazuella sp. AN120528]|uniref:MDR family MFS transporter n=1 Tax=Shimazuella soli TaxID=1892854 RepID=UPI001F0D7C0D|nr:MDR family MFS transporter [Shimazuella soli]MCH5584147.1 MFS transporter [Shimazuella soli]
MTSYTHTEPFSESSKKTKRTRVFVFLLITMFMISIESTIVATAVPEIVAELGNFSAYSWVFSAFLLMQSVTTPIYGKLSDLFGRKPVFLIGTAIFLVGSLLCGLATSMGLLIFYRFIQGIGAGAVMPIATTLVGDLYSLEERSKIQGYLSSVWGISSVVGPLAGGLIVQYVSWAWVFWVNIPLGIASLIGIQLYLHEKVEKKKPSIDYLGASLFSISISALMLILIEGGSNWGWISKPTISLFFVFAITLIFFLWWETRATSPMMPLSLWKNKLIAVANVSTLLAGASMIGLASFLPTYVQGIMGSSALVAGFALTAMSVGWPIAASATAKLFSRIGFRYTAILGGIFLILGSLFFITLDPNKGPIWAGIGSFVIGVGMGFATSTFTISIQSSVGWEMRGVATASSMFMRSVGTTLGTAILGGVLNLQLKNYLDQHHASNLKLSSIDAANILLDPIKKGQLSEKALHLLQNGLQTALHTVFWGVGVFAVLTFLSTLYFPSLQKEKQPES